MKILKNRPTGKELIEYLDIQPIELPDLLRKGLKAYFGTFGEEVHNADTVEEPNWTDDQKRLIALRKSVHGTSSAPPPLGSGNEAYEEHKKRMVERAKMERKIHELEQRRVSTRRPELEGFHWVPFSMPHDHKARMLWLDGFMGLWFKKEEVLSFFENQKVNRDSDQYKTPIEEKVNYDTSVETDIIKEVGRCYDVYKRLLNERNQEDGETTNGNLSHDAWSAEIRKLNLQRITPEDVLGIDIHDRSDNRRRKITSALAKQALKRIYPDKKYTVGDIQKLRKKPS